MDKRWYPVAFSAALVGCSGELDKGHPIETGGFATAYYGVMLPTGGSSAVDTGVPKHTGGGPVIVPYYGVIAPLAGGAPATAPSTEAPKD